MVDKEKILKIYNEFPSHLALKLKTYHEETYQLIKENYEGNSFSEKVYQHVYGRSEKFCNMSDCDEEVEFLGFTNGYREYCSRSCAARKEDPKEIRFCKECGLEFEVYKSDPKKFCSHDCYVTHQIKSGVLDKQLEKARKIQVEKYGGMGWEVEEIKKRGMKTKLEKYGDAGYNNREKSKKTKLERHGDPNYNNRQKARATKLRLYGDPHYNNHEKMARSRRRSKYEKLLNSEKFKYVKPNFEFEDYDGIGYYDDYEFECLKCGEIFEDFLYRGNVPRCPNCWDGWNHVGCSEMEKDLHEFIQSFYGGEIKRNDRSVLESKELDFYIPEKQIAIEFNGIYWHGELNGKGRNYHLNKTRECEDKGIKLIHIFEDEWVFKNNIVKNRLKYILGCSDQKAVYARKCDIKEIETTQKTEFLETYHLQGAGKSKIKLGAFHGKFYNSDLVAVMTFGKPSIAQGHRNSENMWEMKRFAVSKPVVGIAGKLFKHFVREYDPETVITYADRRWSSRLGNVYEKIGFEPDGQSRPNYFYFRDSIQLHHRFNFRKSELDEKLNHFDPDLTEWENMQLNGYDRIWDCGHLKYKWESDD